MSSLSLTFKEGQSVTIKQDAPPFPNAPSNLRTGIDVTRDPDYPPPYPVHCDIRGLTGTVVNADRLQYEDYRLIVEIPYEKDRKAHFLIPASICE